MILWPLQNRVVSRVAHINAGDAQRQVSSAIATGQGFGWSPLFRTLDFGFKPVSSCYNRAMYASLVLNVEAPLHGTFDYHIPRDLERSVTVGVMVEVEFGNSLAQGIVVELREQPDVEQTKPIISLIDGKPVVQSYQIKLARWLSDEYMAPLNACLRLLLPAGLTRWSDSTFELARNAVVPSNPSPMQQQIIDQLNDGKLLRGRDLERLFPKSEWRRTANQLVRQAILIRGSVLDPPRAKPKEVRTAKLTASDRDILEVATRLGRRTIASELLAAMLLSDSDVMNLEELKKTVSATQNHVSQLEEAGVIELVAPDGDASTVQSARLSMSDQEALRYLFKLRAADKYWRVLEHLAGEDGSVLVSELYGATGASLKHLRTLAELGLISLGTVEIWRDPLADHYFVPSEAPALTMDQQSAWLRVREAMKPGSGGESAPKKPFLLFGVTGSGKTEIYMQAIALALEKGQTAIVLVPEIALTPQTVRRFASRFPDKVSLVHSRLTDGERFDTWRKARRGEIGIVIGPRSALFLPLKNVGVIVVDEEHDTSYKQTPPVPPPYYHAREAAIALGRITDSVVILGSATPDLVSFDKAEKGHFHLLELPNRIMGHRERINSQLADLSIAGNYVQHEGDPDTALSISLPPVEIVDLSHELKAGNRSIFSRALQKGISDVLERQEQAMLFLNRRGSASHVFCRDCGKTVSCPKCDSPLTYHRPQAQLSCHYCGRKEPNPKNCPECGSKRIKHFGLGTEEVERQVKATWPQARVVRWDSDTTAGKNRHEELLTSFIKRQSDILIGTQMIAKGLDLPLVTLVGVILADVTLGLPDYRSSERSFQLLAQVAGRAGRGLLGGSVILQTYRPQNYAIQAAAEHDYRAFYQEEMEFRRAGGFPPARRIVKLLFQHHVDAVAEKEASRLAAALRVAARATGMKAENIVGPVPPFFARMRGKFRWQIVLRVSEPRLLLEQIKLRRGWILDFDPVSLL